MGAWEHRHELEVSKSLGTPLKARFWNGGIAAMIVIVELMLCFRDVPMR